MRQMNETKSNEIAVLEEMRMPLSTIDGFGKV